MPSLDSIFQRSPNTPAQVDMPATLGSVSAPLLLLGTSGAPSLWINIGVVGTLTVNGETFTDNGWTLLAVIEDFSQTFANPAQSGEVYQVLGEPTKSAVLSKLATPGANQKWSQGFLRLLSA
jgi:hypothetical protein